jgi:hypothetical protein
LLHRSSTTIVPAISRYKRRAEFFVIQIFAA